MATSSRIMHNVTKLKSSQTGFLNMTMSSLYSNDLQSPDLNPIEHLWDVVEWEICIMDVQLTNLQQLPIWSCQYGPKSLRNVSNTLLNLCHEELRQTWRQRRVQPRALRRIVFLNPHPPASSQMGSTLPRSAQPPWARTITTTDDILEINSNPPESVEVKVSIQSLKSGKACGIDAIYAEMLKADILTSARVLTDLFQDIWNSDTIPEDWSKGLIVKVPKKGNIKSCDNWRGITLLSIPSKVFCRVLLNQMETAIGTKIRQEQAGFSKGRGCMDQIFALRNIIEQYSEWNSPLYIHFVDFRKAFDSVHRNALWMILHSYGIPSKIISIIKTFYEHFECSVITANDLSEWFPVKSGVRQGCIISPILFLVTIDWITTNTTADRSRGIQWTLFSQLEDVDFADDLALLSTNQYDMQVKTDRLSNFTRQVGLSINTSKTQVMCVNSVPTALVNDEPLEFVEDFTYLGSLISKDSGASKDIKTRLGKAQGAFSQLWPIWRSKQYSLKKKMLLYNSNVKSAVWFWKQASCQNRHEENGSVP